MKSHRTPRAPCLTSLPLSILGALAACTSGSSVPAGASAAAPTSQATTPAPASEVGARIYNGNCIACHQQNARGIPGVYPSLVGSAVVLGDPKAFALWVTQGQRAVSMPPGKYPTAMPQYGWMSAHDATALLNYLRSNFGNAAPPVDGASP